MAGNHCELRCQVATKNQDSVKAAFAAPIRHLQSFTCFHMLLQCWSQGTLDLVLQNTTYHQHGGVQDFWTFPDCIPAAFKCGNMVRPNWNPPFGIHDFGLMVEIRSAWVGRFSSHFWELKILLPLKEDENLMLLECEFTNLHIFLNFKFHYPVEYKTQGYLTVNFKHPLGYIIHTRAASFDWKKNSKSPQKRVASDGINPIGRLPPLKVSEFRTPSWFLLNLLGFDAGLFFPPKSWIPPASIKHSSWAATSQQQNKWENICVCNAAVCLASKNCSPGLSWLFGCPIPPHLHASLV